MNGEKDDDHQATMDSKGECAQWIKNGNTQFFLSQAVFTLERSHSTHTHSELRISRLVQKNFLCNRIFIVLDSRGKTHRQLSSAFGCVGADISFGSGSVFSSLHNSTPPESRASQEHQHYRRRVCSTSPSFIFSFFCSCEASTHSVNRDPFCSPLRTFRKEMLNKWEKLYSIRGRAEKWKRGNDEKRQQQQPEKKSFFFQCALCVFARRSAGST